MTMSWRTLFSLTCAVVVPFVLALSARRSSRISLFGRGLRFAAHVHSICGVGGFVNFHLAEFSLQERLGCGSRARCLLFSVFASASCDWGLLAELFFFVAVVLSQVVRGQRHEGTAFPAMRVRHSTGRSVCEREARCIEVRRRLCAKQVHHTAKACPSSEESATTHQERPYMLTKRHTTPALVGADRKKGSRPSLSLPATHTRALAPDQCPRRTKPRLQHAHSRIILRCIATCTDLILSQEEGLLPRRCQ